MQSILLGSSCIEHSASTHFLLLYAQEHRGTNHSNVYSALFTQMVGIIQRVFVVLHSDQI